MADLSLIDANATTIVDRLKAGEVTPHDLLDALEARIAVVDRDVNALPILAFDRARASADALMRRPAYARGVLAGMPVPIKDLTAVKGVRTTQGSPIFAKDVPAASDIVVEKLEAEGGLIYAKSNTSEFGAGAQTFNEVFGQTKNPYDLTRSPAGSSGGAAVALATGMAWVAHGSDLGGSLRNPASFCGVVGLRPSVGRVARDPTSQIDRDLTVQGPMARTVADCALLLDAMVGEDARDPLSLPATGEYYRAAAEAPRAPLRVAYSADLGISPVDRHVAAITRAAAARFADTGAVVEEAAPDFSGAMEAFQVLRAFATALSKAPLLRTHPMQLKPELVWNIEKGLALTMADIERAEATRKAVFQRFLTFMRKYDVLCCPATIVPAFPASLRYLDQCDGVVFQTYVDWLAIVSVITMTGAPAISIPAGFTTSGLPVGLQIVGRPRGEAALLSAAAALEAVLALPTARPIDVRKP